MQTREETNTSLRNTPLACHSRRRARQTQANADVAGFVPSRSAPGGQTAMCGDGRYARLLYVRRAQRTYSDRSLIQNPLERARTEVKLAPGFLVRSAPKPRRVVDRVGA